MNSIDKFISRQRARPVLGVFMPWVGGIGESFLRGYSNMESVKRLHREKLEELRLMSIHRAGFRKAAI